MMEATTLATLYTPAQIVSVALLGVILWGQYKRQGVLKKSTLLFGFGVTAIFIALSFSTYAQWQAFAFTEPTKYLLPPHAPLTYFIQYVWSWYWSQYLLALAGALLIASAIHLAPRSWKEVRFVENEPLLIISGLFLVGHPYWIFYFGGVLLLYCIYVALHAWRAPTSQRVSFYPFWIPVALLAVLLTPALKNIPFMQTFSITLQ